jgi:hypothetical protein
MKVDLVVTIILVFLITSCNSEQKSTEEKPQENQKKDEVHQKFQNKGHELVHNMVQKVGDYNKFLNKEDVVYTYTYKTPDVKTDISTEKYIFNGELSYGAYETHERTLPNLEGLIEQGYDGKEYWLKNNGTIINDEESLKRVAFNRPTNFYWFAMMSKLLDPGLIYEYLGEKEIDETTFEIVKVSFESEDNKPKDIYQVYINKETQLVDQFLFTVMDFEKTEPLLMKVEYENIEGILIPTKRKYKASNWDAEVTDEEWTLVNWTDIKFNNKLSKADFEK